MIPNSSVVILDADPIHARFLEKSLADENITAVSCASAEQCQEKLKARIAKAIFVDLWASKSRHLSFIRWMRQSWPDLRIVAMSNIDSLSLELESLNRGADFFLAKPVDSKSLRQVLSGERTPDSFSGFVQDVDIIEYLQFLLLTEKKLVLEVTSVTGVKCRVYLRDGTVVHADCGGTQGEDALYRCLCFRGGTFSGIPWQEPEQTTIRKAREFLLMEAARTRDEARGPTPETRGLPAVCQLALPGHDRPRSRIGRLSERFNRVSSNG